MDHPLRGSWGNSANSEAGSNNEDVGEVLAQFDGVSLTAVPKRHFIC